jgi:hypothetical protein
MSRTRYWRRMVATALLGATLSLAMNAIAGVAINCGNKPIWLAFYDFGLFHFTENKVATGIDKDIVIN